MTNEKSGSRWLSRWLAASLVMLLSLMTSRPTLAADGEPGHGRGERGRTADVRVEFEKTFDAVRFTTSVQAVEIIILDYFGNPVESAVIRLRHRSPIGLVVPGAMRKIAKENKVEIVALETVGKDRFMYRPKFHGPFKVHMRAVTEAELRSLEQAVGEQLDEEARQLRQIRSSPLY